MQPNRQSLIVLESRRLHAGLAAALKGTGGFGIVKAATTETAAALVAARKPRIDAILIDLSAGEDGAAMCHRLREDGVRIPILVLSATGGEAELLAALAAGASDFVVKPGRLAELAARIRAQIRAVEASNGPVLPVGRYQFHTAQRLLTHARLPWPIRLTSKEAELLTFLYRSSPAPVSRQTLLREVWGYAAHATSHTIESHIYRLRRKIQPDPEGALLLVNDAEGGYRLGYEDGLATGPAAHGAVLAAA